MNLIFLYGPPATGKLTIAQELAAITGYPIFHNHLTRDLVQSLYPQSLDDHYDLVSKLREKVFAYCASHNTDLIFTFVYDGPKDDESVAEKVKTIQENGGTGLFVELTAPHHVLLERVANTSRKAHQKVTDPKLLASLLKENPYPSAPYDTILKIDTSTHTPKQSAEIICQHFNLP